MWSSLMVHSCKLLTTTVQLTHHCPLSISKQYIFSYYPQNFSKFNSLIVLKIRVSKIRWRLHFVLLQPPLPPPLSICERCFWCSSLWIKRNYVIHCWQLLFKSIVVLNLKLSTIMVYHCHKNLMTMLYLSNLNFIFNNLCIHFTYGIQMCSVTSAADSACFLCLCFLLLVSRSQDRLLVIWIYYYNHYRCTVHVYIFSCLTSWCAIASSELTK